MGDVYEAIDREHGGKVALKIMHRRELRGGDADSEHEWEVRFDREVRAIREIRSPHVIQVLDSGVDATTGEHFLAMERLEGEDVSGLLRRLGALPPELAIRIAAQTCLGLQRAHDAGVVHRDIKPGNLFLARDGDEVRVRILDFGVARLGTGGGEMDVTELTRTGSMLGSPQYMAPEQARGSKKIDARADLWSLGVVLYRLLANVLPHRMGEGGLGDLLIAICLIPAPLIQKHAPWVSPETAAVVHRALRIVPDERFASAKDMYESLVALLPDESTRIDVSMLEPLSDEQRQVVALRLPLPSMSDTDVGIEVNLEETVARPSSKVLEATVEPPPPSPPARGGSKVGVVIAAAVLSLAGALTVSSLQHRSSPSPPASQPSPSSPSVAPPPPAAPPVEREVLLKVVGAQEATIDGAPAALDDGHVTLRGAVGSTRRVELRGAGGKTSSSVVAIAESGPVPAVLELEARSPGRDPTKPKVPSPLPVRSSAPAASASQGLRTEFE